MGSQAQGRVHASKETLASDGGSRVEHATRVLFPATRRKYLVASQETHRISKSVRHQICTLLRNTHASGVCGESPQTARACSTRESQSLAGVIFMRQP